MGAQGTAHDTPIAAAVRNRAAAGSVLLWLSAISRQLSASKARSAKPSEFKVFFG
jgi:hypothetical protein